MSPTKPGDKWERTRLAFYGRDRIAAVKLAELAPADFADSRDRRLAEVSGSTLNRDFVLLSHALSVAMKQWRWISVNPLTGVRRPRDAEARDRRISAVELAALNQVAGNSLETATRRVMAAFEFAIETAMRGGEIAGILRPMIAATSSTCRRRRMTRGATSRCRAERARSSTPWRRSGSTRCSD